MGRPKALLPFDGEPLIVHIVATLKQLFRDVVVVAAPGQELPEVPVRLVRDEVPYQGPVGGICYGLGAIEGDAAFVTSCDSAFLNVELISHMLSRLPGFDIVVPYWAGRFQPLHAAYRKSIVPILEEQLARGELRPVSVFDKVRTCRIEEEEIRRYDPGGASFFNMNTPQDYADALQRWRDLRGQASQTSVSCTVELFGVPRLLAQTTEVPLTLPAGATCSHVFSALAEKLPMLVGRVISPDRRRLVDGYACNVNGLEFVRSESSRVKPGDRIVILSADAGG